MCNQLIDESIVPTVFSTAPEGVIHVVTKECPVDPKRGARWDDIRRILPPQEPYWMRKKQTRLLSKSEWYELYEHTYEKDLERYSQSIIPVKAKTISDLVETLEEPSEALMADIVHDSYLVNTLLPCKRLHPDLSLRSYAQINSFRVKYHAFTSCGMLYNENMILVGETQCDDVKEGIARVLTGCEAVADSGDLHEVFGTLVTKDGHWIFLRSLDDKMLIDDDNDNRLVFGEGGKPSRESVEKIAGKLYGMIMTNVPTPEPGWRYWSDDEEEYEEQGSKKLDCYFIDG